METPPNRNKTALVLPGGGARGAFQVGVLKAIAEIVPRGSVNPFGIISGTSAGAINSIVLRPDKKALHPRLSQVLRSRVLYKDNAWLLLEPGRQGRLGDGRVIAGRIEGDAATPAAEEDPDE